MDIEYLHEFAELSRRLNFTATAKALHITQPALSNHIKKLEAETGALLIERSSRDQPRLTPAGQSFLDMSKKIISIYDEALPKVKELHKANQEKIIIRSPRQEYSVPLLEYVFEFQKSHPEIDIVIRPWNEIDGIEDISSGAVDCAYVGFGESLDQEFLQRKQIGLVPYTTTEVQLWIDKSHPLAEEKPLRVTALDGYSVLIPANKKRGSWDAFISSFINRHNLNCSINEKYCDSLEDLALNKATPEDVFLCDVSMLHSQHFQLRESRLTKRFDPPIFVPVSLGHKRAPNNQALQKFVGFLRMKNVAS